MCGEHIFDDPMDRGEKYAISASCARSLNGHIYLFDPNTMETEDMGFPSGTGSWGMIYLPEYGRLVVGTCGIDGKLRNACRLCIYTGGKTEYDLRTRITLEKI